MGRRSSKRERASTERKPAAPVPVGWWCPWCRTFFGVTVAEGQLHTAACLTVKKKKKRSKTTVKKQRRGPPPGSGGGNPSGRVGNMGGKPGGRGGKGKKQQH